MEKISPHEWTHFSHLVRKHWPNITEEELMNTEGYFKQVEYLIEDKTTESVEAIKEELKLIYDKAQEKH